MVVLLTPLEMEPPRVVAVELVYSMISSPIIINPVFVAPTPIFSKELNVDASSTWIGSVEDLSYAAVS